MAWGGKAGEAGARGGGGGALSFIGSEVTITGNVDAAGDMHIDGTVQGDVSCGQITLGTSGTVRGNITAERATLAGTVEGIVTAGDLIVEKSARLSGDLSYDSLSIEAGGKVDGRLTQRTSATGTGELKLVSVAQD
jgi:cytoskeletal protein CcmA (bactofilin family)